MVVEPVHPLQGGQFHRFPGFPGCPAVNQFSFVQAVDGFGQRIVIAVTPTAYGGFNPSFGELFGVPNGDILGGFNRSAQHPPFN